MLRAKREEQFFWFVSPVQQLWHSGIHWSQMKSKKLSNEFVWGARRQLGGNCPPCLFLATSLGWTEMGQPLRELLLAIAGHSSGHCCCCCCWWWWRWMIDVYSISLNGNRTQVANVRVSCPNHWTFNSRFLPGYTTTKQRIHQKKTLSNANRGASSLGVAQGGRARPTYIVPQLYWPI